MIGLVSGPVIPPSRRGSVYTGMIHSSDWLPTIMEGIAGGTVPADTGPTPLDGVRSNAMDEFQIGAPS